MPFTQIKDDLSADAYFDVLLGLAERFSRLPRNSWGYSAAEIEAARQAMPDVTAGLAGPCLPTTLARWYGTVGRTPELTTSQNRLHAPDKLRMLDDVVVIYTENQACAFWGVRVGDLACDDPPVVYTEGKSWLPQADCLSRFALTVGLSELCLSACTYNCVGEMDDAAIAALRSALRLLPAPTLRWPEPERDAFFLANDDTLILMETDFCFAVSLQADIQRRLNGLAAPGRIEW